MRLTNLLTALTVALFAAPWCACAQSSSTPPPSTPACHSIVDVISGDYRFSTLLAAVNALDLKDDLSDKTLTATVFAPTNDAFASILDMLKLTPDQLLANLTRLGEIIEYHVAPGIAMKTSQFGVKRHLDTLLPGAQVEVHSMGPIPRVQAGGGPAANVIMPDVSACNAIVQAIDTVLLPPPASERSAASTHSGFPLYGLMSVSPLLSSLVAFQTAMTTRYENLKTKLEAVYESYAQRYADVLPEAHPLVPIYCLRPFEAADHLDCLLYVLPEGFEIPFIPLRKVSTTFGRK